MDLYPVDPAIVRLLRLGLPTNFDCSGRGCRLLKQGEMRAATRAVQRVALDALMGCFLGGSRRRT